MLRPPWQGRQPQLQRVNDSSIRPFDPPSRRGSTECAPILDHRRDTPEHHKDARSSSATVRDSQSCQLQDSRITFQDQFGKYRRHLPALTRYVAARLRGRDRDAVDDCVHDAFCDALADPSLIGTDALGSLLRLAARAVTRHDWSRRRYVRAAYTVYEDTTRPASRPPGRRPSSRYVSATPWPGCPTTSAAPFNCATWTGTQPPR